MLIVGDLHFDNPAGYNVVDEDGSVTNLVLEACSLALRYVYEVVEIGEAIIFLGDIFEKKDRIDNVVKNSLVKVLRLIKKKDCRLYFLVGNHDKNKEGELTIEFLAKTYGSVVKDVKVVEVEGRRILFIPFRKRDNEAISILGRYRNDDIIVCSHVEIEGADLGYILHSGNDLFKIEDFKGYELVFNGHYHKRQRIGNIRCVGSIYKTDWGDSWNKSIYRIGNGKVKRIDIPDFLGREILKIESESDVEKLKDIDLSNKVVRYDINADSFGAGSGKVVEKLLSEIKTKMSFINLIWSNNKMQSGDVNKVKDIKSGIRQYVESVLNEIESEKARRVYYEVIKEVIK
jgi:calcineurin-like phosphoesterase family protein